MGEDWRAFFDHIFGVNRVSESRSALLKSICRLIFGTILVCALSIGVQYLFMRILGGG